MSNHREVVIGRAIGVRDLNTLIRAVELEKGDKALKTLKRKLWTKGNRDSILAFAREVLATVKEW